LPNENRVTIYCIDKDVETFEHLHVLEKLS